MLLRQKRRLCNSFSQKGQLNSTVIVNIFSTHVFTKMLFLLISFKKAITLKYSLRTGNDLNHQAN